MYKIRVLSVSTLFPNAAAPNFGVFVARQMEAVDRRDDVDVTIINPIGLPPWPLSLLGRYRRLRHLQGDEMPGGTQVLRPVFRFIPLLGGRLNAWLIARKLLPLVRRLHADQPFDVLDAQFFYPEGPAVAYIGRKLAIPFSIKARGSDIHVWGRKPSTAGQVLAAARSAKGLLAVSDGLASDMVALGISKNRITVHRTGLDHSKFRPLNRSACRQRLGLPVEGTLLASVGALIERKGQRFVIEALIHMPGTHLALAGGGTDKAMLMELAARLGVSDRVHFLGAVPHERLSLVLCAADVFVLPSSSEGLANAWVEALACGTPVIASDIPGARELITRPEYGRLVDRDAVAIADAAKALIAENIPREVIAEAAAGFDWEINAAELVEHWNRIAAPEQKHSDEFVNEVPVEA